MKRDTDILHVHFSFPLEAALSIINVSVSLKAFFKELINKNKEDCRQRLIKNFLKMSVLVKIRSAVHWTVMLQINFIRIIYVYRVIKMIVGVLATCRTQYTRDSSI
jgi:hypothetical protein